MKQQTSPLTPTLCSFSPEKAEKAYCFYKKAEVKAILSHPVAQHRMKLNSEVFDLKTQRGFSKAVAQSILQLEEEAQFDEEGHVFKALQTERPLRVTLHQTKEELASLWSELSRSEVKRDFSKMAKHEIKEHVKYSDNPHLLSQGNWALAAWENDTLVGVAYANHTFSAGPSDFPERLIKEGNTYTVPYHLYMSLDLVEVRKNHKRKGIGALLTAVFFQVWTDFAETHRLTPREHNAHMNLIVTGYPVSRGGKAILNFLSSLVASYEFVLDTQWDEEPSGTSTPMYIELSDEVDHDF